jgi:hypothetical protein
MKLIDHQRISNKEKGAVLPITLLQFKTTKQIYINITTLTWFRLRIITHNQANPYNSVW